MQIANVIVNNVEAQSSPIDIATTKIDSVAVSPASVSPVVRQDLDITVGSLPMPGAQVSEFTAMLVS